MSIKNCNFEDLVDFYDHQRVPLSSLVRDKRQGDYPYYGAQGIIDSIDDYVFDGEYVLIAEDGANLVTRKQPIAQIAKGKFWVNNHAHVVKAKKGVSTDFYIIELLNSISISGYTTGAAQPKLSQKNLRAIKVQVPFYEVQEQISSILRNYSELIENNNRRTALLEESARLLYQEWFVYLRFPGHQHCKIIDGIPEGWSIQKTDSISQTIGGGTPSTKKPVYWDDGDVVWFSPTDLTKNNSIALLDSAKKITNLGLQKSSAKQLPPRTILMTSRASIGYFGIFEGVATTNQGFISLVPNQENFRWYLLHNLSSRVDEIKGLAGGATFKEINKTTFRNIDVLMPTNNLLDLFSEYYSKVYEQILNLSRQNKKLTEARDILLPRLMNGEIVV